MTGSDPLTTAKRLLGRDNAGALAAARAAHALRATPETTLLLATALRRTGDASAAAALLEPLAARAPQAWGVQHELGIALAASGDDAGAMAALERAATLNPQATGPAHALRDLRMLAGEAVGNGLAALQDARLRDAIVAFLDEDEGARDTLGRLALDPHDVAAACLIAEIGVAEGRGAPAVGLLAAALALAPAYRPARFRLAEALHRADRDAEALEALQPLGIGNPAATIRALRGAILMRLGREDEALLDLAAVADARPDHAFPQLALGHALRAIGRRDDAIAAYRRALAIDPMTAEAWLSIADLKAAVFADDDVAAMERLVTTPDLPILARSQVEFALGRAREDRGEDAAAFAHYAAGNELRRSVDPWYEVAHRRFVRSLIETTGETFFRDRAGSGHADPMPIFVLGMPRSGSTLVEQILASHSQVEGLSELPEITNLARSIAGYPAALATLSRRDLERLGADYIAQVGARRRTGAPHVIDKFPGNAFHAALIHLILPDARIVDVRRDPRDCCVSLYAQSFAAGQGYSYDLGTLGRYYSRYEALMRHFDQVLPGRILRVSYEALVDDLEGQTRRLLDHCGLAFEPATLRFFERQGAVRTASSEQVRRPIYRSSVGRWERFAPWLDDLDKGLADSRI